MSPTDAAKTDLAAFKGERAEAGATFPAAELAAADGLAARAADALADGNPAAAARLARDARWALPFRPPGLPAHVLRVLGVGRLRHADRVNAVAYSPDGTRLASASRDGTVRVWDLGNGREVVAYRGHAGPARGRRPRTPTFSASPAVAFAPDGSPSRRPAGNGRSTSGTPATGKRRHTLTGPQGAGPGRRLRGRPEHPRLRRGRQAGDRLGRGRRRSRSTSPAQARAGRGGGRRRRTGRPSRPPTAAGELSVYPPGRRDEGRLDCRPGHRSRQAGVRGRVRRRRRRSSPAAATAASRPPARPGPAARARGRGPAPPYAGHADKVNALAADRRRDGRRHRPRGPHRPGVGRRHRPARFVFVPGARRPGDGRGRPAGRPGRPRPAGRTASSASGRSPRGRPPGRSPTPPARSGRSAVSPDGKRFATAGADRVVRVYDAATGQPVNELTGHAGAVTGGHVRRPRTGSRPPAGTSWSKSGTSAAGTATDIVPGTPSAGPGRGRRPGRRSCSSPGGSTRPSAAGTRPPASRSGVGPPSRPSAPWPSARTAGGWPSGRPTAGSRFYPGPAAASGRADGVAHSAGVAASAIRPDGDRAGHLRRGRGGPGLGGCRTPARRPRWPGSTPPGRAGGRRPPCRPWRSPRTAGCSPAAGRTRPCGSGTRQPGPRSGASAGTPTG